MIRDHLIVGLRFAQLSEKLQLDPELTLKKVVTQVRQSEAIKLKQAVLRGEGAAKNELPVNKGKQCQDRPAHCKKWGNRSSQPATQGCTRYGLTPTHDKARCPARDAVCHKCGKRGHYERTCRSNVKVDAIQDTSDSPFLGAVSKCTETTENPWVATVLLNGTSVQFQIDAGAEVTVIPKSMFTQLEGANLQPSQKTLRGPSQYALPVTGQFRGRLALGNQEVQQDVYVIGKLLRPLLGRPAIEALGLLACVRAIERVTNLIERFPKLFQGLGKMQGEYITEGATPFALTTPRQVAIPLLESVKSELENMEKQGVISRVQEPTDWCAGIVVVPRLNNRVRICVDLTKLNKCVCRELHPLPVVEQILAQVAGARVFSKLDANLGFWQIPLSAKSSLLTTFITPFGRFRFNRIPFGITSALEHFQRRMSKILRDLNGGVCLMDDILVYSSTQDQHDQRLVAVLEKLQDTGVPLNK